MAMADNDIPKHDDNPVPRWLKVVWIGYFIWGVIYLIFFYLPSIP